jgi:Leucine-rich repeat (LRR) protein
MNSKRVNVSRSKTNEIPYQNMTALGASYTHVKSLQNVIGPDTQKIIMYHTYLESLEGLEKSSQLDQVYLGFNRIKQFRPEDKFLPKINVLDLAGNPIESLENSPLCDSLIVSATLIPDLKGAQEGITIIRCGHSTHLKSLEGCPSTVKIIECSCAPNLIIQKEHLPPHLEELLTDKD